MAVRARFRSPSTKAPPFKLQPLSKETVPIVVWEPTQPYRPLTSPYLQTYRPGMSFSHGQWDWKPTSLKRLTKIRTWFNREKEFNMNCAAVTIAPPAESVTTPTVPYSKRPGPLIADIPDPDNGCWTPKETAEVKYPNPGPDVVQGDGVYPLALPMPPAKCGY